MRVTREFIVQGKNEPGGWNKEQIRTLGDEWWPLQTGWIDRIEDTKLDISLETAQKFLSLKGHTQKERNRRIFQEKKVYVLQEHESIIGVFSSRTLAESANEEYLRKEKIAYGTYIVECCLDSLVEE